MSALGSKRAEVNDKADTIFAPSADSSINWAMPLRVSSDFTTNDQWMPVLAVKSDRTQLFMSWYDRRNDTNNSLIEVYGRFGSIATNGTVPFGSEIVISTTNFPPVFAGTLLSNTNQGHYDPVYPPAGVNLHWHYDEWTEPPPPSQTDRNVTFNGYIGHVGEYNGAWAEEQHVIVTWTDYRLAATGTLYARNQSDVRFARFNWP